MSNEKKARWVGTIKAMGRSRAVVVCTCGHENRFYLWSWSGHGKAKCKGCHQWIFREGLDVAESDKARMESKFRCVTANGKPDYHGFAKALRAEMAWEEEIKRGDKTGQLATDVRQLSELAAKVEEAGQSDKNPLVILRLVLRDGRPDFGGFSEVLRNEATKDEARKESLLALASSVELIGQTQGYL